MVHRDPKNKENVAIVSVLFEHSYDIDQDFMMELNPRMTTVHEPRPTLSLASKLWYNLYGNFIMYDGSVNIPNCEETAIWFVFTDV